MTGAARAATPAIRPAGPGDAPALARGLAELARSMGDPFRADVAALERGGFGPAPIFRALLAGEGPIPAGVCLYWPVFSTVMGGPGLYVSDLWTAKSLRGAGLGRRLLAAARDAARRDWDAGFLKLAVYDDNPKARAFYDRLGFAGAARETALVLSGPAFDQLGETR